MEYRDLVIIGGGSAGMAAAIGAYNEGIKDILILEKGEFLGGILNQCIHNGFGLTEFKEELTGPEFAARFIEQVKEKGIEFKLHSFVTDISAYRRFCGRCPRSSRRTSERHSEYELFCPRCCSDFSQSRKDQT